MRGAGQQLGGVLLREVRRKHHHRTEMQTAVGHRLEDRGELPGRARGADALEGRVLGHVQHLDAVGEHRREALLRVEAGVVDLGDVREHLGGCAAIPGDDGGEIA